MFKKIFTITVFILLALIAYDWMFGGNKDLENEAQGEITSYDAYYQEALKRNSSNQEKYSVTIDMYEALGFSQAKQGYFSRKTLLGNQLKDTFTNASGNLGTPLLEDLDTSLRNSSNTSGTCSGIIFDPCIELFVKGDNFPRGGGMDFKSSTPDL